MSTGATYAMVSASNASKKPAVPTISIMRRYQDVTGRRSTRAEMISSVTGIDADMACDMCSPPPSGRRPSNVALARDRLYTNKIQHQAAARTSITMANAARAKSAGVGRTRSQRPRPTGAQLVYAALRRAIVVLDIEPGSPLEEERLCRHYKVSRTP